MHTQLGADTEHIPGWPLDDAAAQKQSAATHILCLLVEVRVLGHGQLSAGQDLAHKQRIRHCNNTHTQEKASAKVEHHASNCVARVRPNVSRGISSLECPWLICIQSGGCKSVIQLRHDLRNKPCNI